MTADDEAGFTLVELLVTIVILGAIVGAIGTAIVVGLRTTDATQVRLAESHDAQMTSAFFGNDVQSASDVTLNAVSSCSGTISVVSFQWNDAGVSKVASYSVRSTATETQLLRRYCEGISPAAEVVIAHLVADASAVTAACQPAADCSGAHPWKPIKVTISVTDQSGYAYSISASRRATL
jgi:prepilin-type N-terminal cleavage/methylation domain-containing protein